MTMNWLPTPVGIDAARWASRTGYRTVLAVAHTIASTHRILDVAEYVETDQRVQVVFTVAPDTFNRGVRPYLESLGALVLPWEQATHEYFDLAIAAAYGGLHELHAPCVTMAHGAGRGKRVRPGGHGGTLIRDAPIYGLDAQRLVHNGRLVPATVILSHQAEWDILRRQCPEALPVSVIAGDPCFDRLLVSRDQRPEYRRAFGIAEEEELVVMSSTWGADGLFGSMPGLFSRIIAELSSESVRAGTLLHPAVWSAHGSRQVRAWLHDSLAAGLILPDPTTDWRSLLIAADYVIGDHGSVTTYAAAIGTPVLHVPAADRSGITPGSAPEIVVNDTEELDLDRPVLPQLRRINPIAQKAVAAALTSRPGEAAGLIRRTLYGLLGLPEPDKYAEVKPVPVTHLGAS